MRRLKGSRLVGAGLANLLTLGLQSVIFLAMTPVLVRVAGAEVYGLWTMLVSVAGFAGLANFSTQTTMVKYVAAFALERHDDERLSAALTFGSVLLLGSGLASGVVLWMIHAPLARWLAGGIPEASAFARGLAFLAAAMIPLFLLQFARGVLLGLFRNATAGGLDVLQIGFLLGGAVVISARQGGIDDLGRWIAAVNAAVCLLAIGLAYRALSGHRLRWRWDPPVAREMTRYSAYAWLSTIGSVLFSTGDRLLVGASLGPVAAGAYGLCTGVAMRLNQLCGIFTQLMLPLASAYQAGERHRELQRAFRYGMRLSGGVLAAAAAVLYIWAEPLLSFWISPAFAASYTVVFRLLIICYAVFSLDGPGHQMAHGLGRPRMPAIVGILGGSAMLIGIAALAPRFGLVGAAAANFAYVIVLTKNLWVARWLGLRPLRTLWWALAAPLLLLATVVAAGAVAEGLWTRGLLTLGALLAAGWLSLDAGRHLGFLRMPLRATGTSAASGSPVA